jgi:glycosyltransferase involved in cell wall biosynthesis
MVTDMPVVLDVRVVTGSGGGPEKTILNSPRFLKPYGYRMLCAYMHPPGDPGFEQIVQRARDWGAPLLSVPDRGSIDPSVLGKLLQICRRERVAIWNAHDYKSNLIGLLLRPFWPMRLVTTVHGYVQRTWRTPLYYAVDRFSLPRYERVICVSQDLDERCRRLGVPADRCLLIENGIDVDQFVRRTPPAVAKQRLGLPPDRLIIGAVGRLSPEKGFDLLIRAADRLLGQGLDVELIIAGDGAQRSELEALITALGRHERIRLTGYCSDTLALYEALDVFALSSLREGLPNVLLEAMAMELPVVATRVAGVPNLVRHGENGLITRPGSVEGLVESLARLLRDVDLRERLSRAGRATVAAEFSFEVRMRKVVEVFDGLLAREPSPSPLVSELTS